MAGDLEYRADMLVGKIMHYLITTMGRTSDEANADEFYCALSYALREEVMINWLATGRTGSTAMYVPSTTSPWSISQDVCSAITSLTSMPWNWYVWCCRR